MSDKPYLFAHGENVTEFIVHIIHKERKVFTIDVPGNKITIKGKETSIEKFLNLIK